MKALLDAWRDDLRYRISRVKARMKFMVDDRGPEGMRAEVEARLGYALPDFTLEPLDHEPADHMGVEPEHDEGVSSVGAPVHLGLISGDQMLAVADLAASSGPRHPPHAAAEPRRHRDHRTWTPPRRCSVRSASPSMRTGCARTRSAAPASRTATSPSPRRRAARHADRAHRRALRRPRSPELRLHLDGCPHACGQHWVGDLGFQGTTVRDDEGKRHQAYDILLRGALGPVAAIGRPVFRRVPTDELNETVESLIVGVARGPHPERELPVVLRPHDRRRARCPDRPRAGPVPPR